MNRALLLVLCLLLAPSFSYAEIIKTSSRITDVTVYPGMASVTRTAEVKLPAGDHTILLDDIVPQINDTALSVRGEGQAEVRLFGASVQSDFLAASANDRVKEIQGQIEAIDDQQMDIANQQKTVAKEQEYLDGIKMKSGEQYPKEMLTKMPAATELETLGAFLTKRYTAAFSQSEQLRMKSRELQRERDALQMKLNQVQSGNQNVKHGVGVEVQCIKPGSFTVMVSYLVYGVSWTPVYDARANFDKSNVELSMFGQISQNTGEDWDGVNLTISTAQPTVGGRMPELYPWVLSVMPDYGKMDADASVPMGARKSLMHQAAMTNAPAPAMDMAVAGMALEEKASTGYANIETKGVSAVFKVSKKSDIKSDGVWHRVPVTVVNVPVTFEYASTPRLNNYAYLKAGIVNKQEATLLPGNVNIYLDGDYVGNSTVDKAIGANEQFDLYLGVDEGVSVKYKLLEQKSDDTMFGNIPSPNRSVHYSYKITVENHKPKAIAAKVYDHVPVSQDDKIKVKDIKFTPEPSKKNIEDRSGVMRWSLDLKPGEKKEVLISYTVEYPRNLNVGGL